MNSKKDGFFSWLRSKIKKQKIQDIIQDNNEKKNCKDQYNKKKCVEKNLLMQTSNIKNNEHNKLNHLENRISKDVENNTNIKTNFFSRLKQGLKKTKKFLNDSINNIFFFE